MKPLSTKILSKLNNWFRILVLPNVSKTQTGDLKESHFNEPYLKRSASLCQVYIFTILCQHTQISRFSDEQGQYLSHLWFGDNNYSIKNQAMNFCGTELIKGNVSDFSLCPHHKPGYSPTPVHEFTISRSVSHIITTIPLVKSSTKSSWLHDFVLSPANSLQCIALLIICTNYMWEQSIR